MMPQSSAVTRLIPALAAVAVIATGCASATTRTGSEPVTAGPGASNLAADIGLKHDAELAALIGDISTTRIRETDSALVSFGTRHAMSDTTSTTRGVGAARRYLFAKLSAYGRDCGGCLRVEYDPGMVEVTRHPQKPTINVVNVLAWLPGRDTTRVLVMGGHYDSCICSIDRFDATSDAPGADDDGSGTSAVVELARVFSRHYPKGLDATVIFALYSGEELGLLGSTHLAARLHAQKYDVVAGMTDDIVGNVIADDGRVDSTSIRIFGADPDTSASRELARYAWGTANVYDGGYTVLPVFRLDRISRGGDHAPFVTLHDPGLRFTERLENYKRQHLPTDRFDKVSFGYVTKVARFNAAVVGSLASAPRPPDSLTSRRDQPSGGQKWMLTWKAAPGAAGYEVLLRRTFAPTYERVIPVGNVTSYLLPDQLDDLWAAVRSVGANGHRSRAATVAVARPITQ
jgi:hypothetical protein